MKRRETALRPVGKVRGGAHVPHHKNTAELTSAKMPAPKTVYIPMQQHIGAPCEPIVKKGDTVFVGTKIGDSSSFVFAPIHSSVSGTVIGIEEVELSNGNKVKAVVIENDFTDTLDPAIKPVKVKTPEDLVSAAKECGLVGLGGAGFPAHIKLTINEDKKIDTLIINAAECEPFITADYRECMEASRDILEGIYLLKEILNIEKVIIGVEDNKPRAIKVLLKIAGDKKDPNNDVRVMKLKANYPQGAEKMLIYSATKRALPNGKLPSDVGCIVMNVTSVATLNRYINTGIPLISRRVTVDGNAINNPQNVIVPIGTKISDVIEFCGGFKKEPKKIIVGGPMMGTAIYNLDTPISKQNNAILAFYGAKAETPKEYACISCGRCAKYCPMNLTPGRVEKELNNAQVEELKALNVDYCMECGSCSFVCPSRKRLTQYMRMAKAELRKNK